MKEKECKTCKEVKSISEFYSQKRESKKKGKWIYYNPECKECCVERVRKNRADDPTGKKRNQRLSYYNVYNHTEKARQIRKDYGKKRNEEGYNVEYYNENKEKFTQYRTDRANKHHDINTDEWQACKSYFDYSCAYCGLHENDHYVTYAGELKKTDLHKEHVDHYGSNDLSNCVPSCKTCNSSKWTHDIEYWYTNRNEHYSEDKLDKIKKWLKGDYELYISNKTLNT